MRTYLPVFVITLLIAWAFLGWFGDYNAYVGDLASDGRAWVKEKGTTTDRVFWSFVLSLIFAAVETGILWFLHKMRK